MASAILAVHYMFSFSLVHLSLARAGPVVVGNYGVPVGPDALRKSYLRNSLALSCQYWCFFFFFWLFVKWHPGQLAFDHSRTGSILSLALKGTNAY